MKNTILIFLSLSIALAGCSLPQAASTPTIEPGSPTPSPTATFTPSQTATLSPTETPTITLTPTIMPTIEPMIGILRAPTNIRARPSKGGSDRLGGMYFNQGVNVIGRNDRANWLWIIYPDSPTGTAWILANAVDLQGEIGLLPIIIFPEDPDTPLALPPLLPPSQGTSLPINTPGPEAMLGTAAQLLNVRVGPGLGYMSMGTLPAGTVMSMTGRIEENTWLQIEYPSGPGGRAWVAAELVTLDVGMKRLPVYNLLATPVTEAPPQAEAPTATPPNGTSIPPTETPILPTPTPKLPLGKVTAQINVRSGPASSFESLGMLNINDDVRITGQTLNGVWLQIEYPAAPDGKGWVAAAYITLYNNINKLPVFDNQGTPLPQP